jgi:hypothetical protein
MKYLKVYRRATSRFGTEQVIEIVDKVEDDDAQYFKLQEVKRRVN